MTGVTPWAPTYDFQNDEAPQNLINAAAVQAQLNLLANYLANLEIALGTSIGDDNTLVDGLVRLRNLHADLATYIESRVTGTVLTQSLLYYLPVRLKAVGNVALLAGAQTVDGESAVSLDRVLLADQTDPTENGLWVVHEVGDPAPHAAGLWVRADDLPAGDEAGSGWGVIVAEGTANIDSAWAPVTGSDTTPVVGTDELTFFPVFGPFPIPITRGGTGATTVAGAATALGFMRRATGTITGDAVTKVFVIAHSLATKDVLIGVREDATDEDVLADTKRTVGNVTVTFATAPAALATYTVTIIG